MNNKKQLKLTDMNIYELQQMINRLLKENNPINSDLIEFYTNQLNDMNNHIAHSIVRVLNGLDPLPFVQKTKEIDPKELEVIFSDPIFN